MNSYFCSVGKDLADKIKPALNPLLSGDFEMNKKLKENATSGPRGGGGTSLWVRRGCAPVLGSFWPENSGIGVSFYWKISVIGVYFHSEFSGIGGYSKFCNGC